MALALAGDTDVLRPRLPTFLNYAELVGDQSAKICVAFVLGMQSLQTDEILRAVAEFETAKALYITGGQDTEVDLELELYLLEARVRAEGWSEGCRRLLAEISAYVDVHSYSYYRPVLRALEHLSRNEAHG